MDRHGDRGEWFLRRPQSLSGKSAAKKVAFASVRNGRPSLYRVKDERWRLISNPEQTWVSCARVTSRRRRYWRARDDRPEKYVMNCPRELIYQNIYRINDYGSGGSSNNNNSPCRSCASVQCGKQPRPWKRVMGDENPVAYMRFFNNVVVP